MRRFITIFAVILLTVGCCSCSRNDDGKTEKKSGTTAVGELTEEKTEENTVSTKDVGIYENTTSGSAENRSDETYESISAEEDFKFLSDNDFRNINVKLTMTNKQLPGDIRTIDVSELNMGERIPIFNKAEYFEEAYRKNSFLKAGEDWSERKECPEKANIVRLYRKDNKVYIAACYGKSRTDSYQWTELFYEFAVFCYDLETQKSQEVFSWSSDSLDKKCYDLEFCNEKLFYSVSEPEKYYVESFDLSSKEEKIIFEENSKGKISVDAFEEIERLLLHNDDDELYFYNLKEDIALGQEEYITLNEEEYAAKNKLKNADMDKINQFLDSFSPGTIITGPDYYFLSEDYLGMTISVNKDRFILSSGYRIDTFDTAKKEHYISSLDQVGVTLFEYDGKVLLSGINSIMCLVPEMGLVYNVLETGSINQEISINSKIIYDCTEGNEKLYILNSGSDRMS